jgi:hypothetical protein
MLDVLSQQIKPGQWVSEHTYVRVSLDTAVECVTLFIQLHPHLCAPTQLAIAM